MNAELFVIMLCLVIGVSILLAARMVCSTKRKGYHLSSLGSHCEHTRLVGFSMALWRAVFWNARFEFIWLSERRWESLVSAARAAPITTLIGVGIVWRFFDGASEG